MRFNKHVLLSSISVVTLFLSVLWPHVVLGVDALTMISATLSDSRTEVLVDMSSDIHGGTLGVTDFSVGERNPDSVNEIEEGVILLSFISPLPSGDLFVVVYGDGTQEASPNGVRTTDSLAAIWTNEHSIQITGPTASDDSDEKVPAGYTIVDYAMTGDEVWDAAHSPYIVYGFSIPEGKILTIEAGTIVKMGEDQSIIVEGTLDVQGTASDEVYITSVTDPSVGGGSGTPSASDWNQILFREDSVGNFVYTNIQYGDGIQNEGGYITMENVHVTNHSNIGYYQISGTADISGSVFSSINSSGMHIDQGDVFLSGNEFSNNIQGIQIQGSGTAEIFDNTFTHNSDVAINFKLHPGRAYAHSGNVAANNGMNAILVELEGSTQPETITLSRDDLPYVIGSMTLTTDVVIDPGTIIKFLNDGALRIPNSLTVLGTEELPVYFTSIKDDGVGGDTNGDGTETEPVAQDWMEIEFEEGSVGDISHAYFLYGGLQIPYHGSGASFFNNGGTVSIDNSIFNHTEYAAYVQESGVTTITDSFLSAHDFNILIHEGGLTISQSTLVPSEYAAVQNGGQGSVDVRNNWWGDASGPYQEFVNPGGLGGVIEGSMIFNPWLTEEPGMATSTDDGTQEEENDDPACCSSILFLPGIMASRLYADGVALWEPTLLSNIDSLLLNNSGNSVDGNIYTKDVIDQVPVTGSNIYKSFIADLEIWKHDDGIIADYSVVPYDWRLSLDDVVENGKQEGDRIYYDSVRGATSTPYIVQELTRLAEESPTGRVSIIAHSNGGLVAKKLLKNLEDTNNSLLSAIDTLILVAVPQIGTPHAIGALLHGYDMGLPSDLFSPILSPAEARKLAQNAPMSYHLLPSEQYISTPFEPVATFVSGDKTDIFIDAYDTDISDISEYYSFIDGAEEREVPSVSDTRNPARSNFGLFTYGIDTHDELDNWSVPTSIVVHQIAGWGVPTLKSIEYRTEDCLIAVFCEEGSRLLYSPKVTEQGDGKVMDFSALAMDESANVHSWWVDLKTYNLLRPITTTLYTFKTKHPKVLEISSIRDFIKSRVILKETDPLPDYIETNMPSVGFSRIIKIILHSPLTLSVIDGDGNTLSVDTSEIPGGYYMRFGEVQYISVPKSVEPTILLDGEDDGIFTLEIEEVNENETSVSTSIFSAIPTTSETKVSVEIGDEVGPLYIDQEGDGIDDLSISLPPSGIATYENVVLVAEEESEDDGEHNDDENGEGDTDEDSDESNEDDANEDTDEFEDNSEEESEDEEMDTITRQNPSDGGGGGDGRRNEDEELSEEVSKRLLVQIHAIARAINELTNAKQKSQVAGISTAVSVQKGYTKTIVQKETIGERVEDVRIAVRDSILGTVQKGWKFISGFKGF